MPPRKRKRKRKNRDEKYAEELRIRLSVLNPDVVEWEDSYRCYRKALVEQLPWFLQLPTIAYPIVEYLRGPIRSPYPNCLSLVCMWNDGAQADWAHLIQLTEKLYRRISNVINDPRYQTTKDKDEWWCNEFGFMSFCEEFLLRSCLSPNFPDYDDDLNIEDAYQQMELAYRADTADTADTSDNHRKIVALDCDAPSPFVFLKKS